VSSINVLVALVDYLPAVVLAITVTQDGLRHQQLGHLFLWESYATRASKINMWIKRVPLSAMDNVDVLPLWFAWSLGLKAFRETLVIWQLTPPFMDVNLEVSAQVLISPTVAEVFDLMTLILVSPDVVAPETNAIDLVLLSNLFQRLH
jgi:hypothetical protein